MPLVATKDLAIAIDDYYEVGGIRYTVKALNPRSFVSGKVPATATVFSAGTSEVPSEISPKVLQESIDASTPDEVSTADIETGTATTPGTIAAKTLKESIDASIPDEVSAADIATGTETTPGTIAAKTIKDAIGQDTVIHADGTTLSLYRLNRYPDATTVNLTGKGDATRTQWFSLLVDSGEEVTIGGNNYSNSTTAPQVYSFEFTAVGTIHQLNAPVAEIPVVAASDIATGTVTTPGIVSAKTLKESIDASIPDEVSAADITAGTSTTAGIVSAKVIKDAIDAKASPGWLPDANTIAIRDALTNVKIGHKIRVLDAGDTRWAVFEARGDSPTPNWFQLTDQDNLNSPLPNLSSADAIAGTATAQSLISAATLKSATGAASRWPTIQASLDRDVTIASGTVPSLIHLNTGTRPGNLPWITTWNVATALDGEHHLVQTFDQERALTIAGATAILVNGSAIGGNTVNLAAGVSATITHTLNMGQRFVNVLTGSNPSSANASLSFLATGPGSGQTTTAGGVVTLNAITFFANPGNATSASLLSSGRVRLPEAGRVRVSAVFFRASGSNGTAGLGYSLALYGGTTTTVKQSVIGETTWENERSYTLPTVDLDVAAGDTLALVTPAAITVWGVFCKISVTYVASSGIVLPEASISTQAATISVSGGKLINGAATTAGWVGVNQVAQITLGANKALDSASLSATGATVTIDNSTTGRINIRPTAETVVITAPEVDTTTTTVRRTASSGTRVLLLSTTAQNYNVGVVLQEGDMLTLWGDYGNNPSVESHSMNYRVVAGAALRPAAWPASDHLVTVTFPATLTNDISVTHGSGSNAFRLRGWEVQRDSTVAVAVPTATVLASPRTITATLDGVATTLNGEASVIRAEGTTAFLRIPLPSNRRLTSAVGGFVESAESGLIRVDVGATNVAIVATSGFYRRSVTANVNVNGGASATVEANVPTVIQLEVPNNQQITAVTATNGAARPIGGAGAVEVIPNNAGDMVLTATLAALSPNLADTSLGTFDDGGTGDNTATFVQNRTGARIKEMTFTFRDRRSSLSARTTTVTVPADAFGGASGTNWTLRFENSFRYGISRRYSLGGANYIALIQWAPLPTGYMFWFQSWHSDTWNTYGRFENVTIKWEAE